MKPARTSNHEEIAPLPPLQRPEILDRMDLDRHMVVEASAGTGKTFTLTCLVIELLLKKNIRIEQILILTYTEKAAGELRRRIRETIGRLQQSNCSRIADGVKEWTIDRHAQQRLETAMCTLDQAPISTIHAFFQRVLTENAFAIRRPLVQTIEDGRRLFSSAFKKVLRSRLARDPGHQKLLAAWLIQSSVDELEELLFECGKKRADVRPDTTLDELERLFECPPPALFELDTSQLKSVLKVCKVHASTAKSVAEKLDKLRSGILELRSGGLAVADFCDNFEEPIHYLSNKLTNLAASELAELIAYVRQLADRWTVLKALVVKEFLPIVQATLREEKLAYGLYDFDDMISLVAEALDSPGGAALAAQLRKSFRYALIDEFQDTDDLQWRVFREVFVNGGGANRLVVIGDPKQAIYGFRGADVHAYLQARSELLDQARALPVVLDKNYRSTPLLINAYNRIFDQKAPQPFFEGQICYDQPVSAGTDLVAADSEGNEAGAIQVGRLGAEQNLKADDLRWAFGQWIAAEIHKLLFTEAGALFIGRERRRVQARDIFILTATGREGQGIASYLRALGIPHAFYKQDGLFQTSEAAHFKDLLAGIAAPEDRTCRLRAWLTPFFAVPLDSLPDCLDLDADHPLVRRLLDWNRLADARRYEQLFGAIFKDSRIVRRELLLKSNERALTNYLHIAEILLEEARRRACDLHELVRRCAALIEKREAPLDENGNVQRLETERDAVQILTMHKSKGLEAAVVFLYGGFSRRSGSQFHEYHDNGRRILDFGNPEEIKQLASAERQEEWGRLLYVAVTRARARLYLPMVDPECCSKQPKGGYLQLNERLNRMLAGMDGLDEQGHFLIVNVNPNPQVGTLPKPGFASHLADRMNDSDLPVAPDKQLDFDRLRREHSGFLVNSYTRIKKSHGGYHLPVAVEEFQADAVRQPRAVTTEDDLPGGASTGTFLHEILEEMPFETLADRTGLEEWSRDPVVEKLFAASAKRHGIAGHCLPTARRLIYAGLTTPIELKPMGTIPGIRSCANNRREVEFLYPWPESASPSLAEDPCKEFVIERGYVTGFMDLVFEHGGMTYVADWKSDTLLHYDSAAIAEHVRNNYLVQIKLYALALARMLGVHSASDHERRFGGLIYLFLRGMGSADHGQGVYSCRPSWTDLLDFERQLLQGDDLALGDLP